MWICWSRLIKKLIKKKTRDQVLQQPFTTRLQINNFLKEIPISILCTFLDGQTWTGKDTISMG